MQVRRSEARFGTPARRRIVAAGERLQPNSCTIYIVDTRCRSAIARAANNNLGPSSQDRQGSRGAVQWLGHTSSGLWTVQG